MLTIAVSKGRIFEDCMPLLREAGIVPIDDPKTSRKLILETTRSDVQLIIIRATDVPTFVEYGAADLGIAGKDVLLEHGAESLYEPLDLNIACCRLMTATPKEYAGNSQTCPGRNQVCQNCTALFCQPWHTSRNN